MTDRYEIWMFRAALVCAFVVVGALGWWLDGVYHEARWGHEPAAQPAEEPAAAPVLEHARQPLVAQASDMIPPPSAPVALTGWENGTPMSLFDPETYGGLRYDLESFDRWVGTWIPDERERRALWELPSAREAYYDSVQLMALRAFTMGYGDREAMRADAGDLSVDLYDEIGPDVWTWIEGRIDAPSELRDAMLNYGRDVHGFVRDQGRAPWIGEVSDEHLALAPLHVEWERLAREYLLKGS